MSEVWCLSYLCPDQPISHIGNGFSGLLLAGYLCLHSTTTFEALILSSCFSCILPLQPFVLPQSETQTCKPH